MLTKVHIQLCLSSVLILFPLEKVMATHSGIPTWRIPKTEEPGWLQSLGLQRVGHDWTVNTNTDYFRSVQFSPSVVSSSLWPHGLQHTKLPYPSPTPRAYSNSCLLNQWCHLTISSCRPLRLPPSIFPATGSFHLSQFFASGGQSIGVSASASVLPMSIQDWFPLGWTGWISLQSKGLLRVFSNTTIQKHQFFSAQLSL